MKKILLIAASALMVCGCNENEKTYTKEEKYVYRTTIFVREVLNDGTMSYSRIYETDYRPHIDYHDGVLYLGELITNAPYIVERVTQTEQ